MTATEIDNLKQSICDSCGITVDDMMGRSRVSMCVYARRILCSMMREDGYILQDIADIFGFSHATVYHHIKAHKDAMQYDKLYKSIVDEINLESDTAKLEYIEAHRKCCLFLKGSSTCDSIHHDSRCDSECEYMRKFNGLIEKV